MSRILDVVVTIGAAGFAWGFARPAGEDAYKLTKEKKEQIGEAVGNGADWVSKKVRSGTDKLRRKRTKIEAEAAGDDIVELNEVQLLMVQGIMSNDKLTLEEKTAKVASLVESIKAKSGDDSSDPPVPPAGEED